jgi:hypothetical protein
MTGGGINAASSVGRSAAVESAAARVGGGRRGR